MRFLVAILIFTFAIQCRVETSVSDIFIGEEQLTSSNHIEKIEGEEVDNSYQKSFLRCFASIDSNQVQNVVGCQNRCFYKVLNDDKVLMIHYKTKLKLNHCKHYDTLTKEVYAELQIFKKGEANLTNYCTDIRIVNTPEPLKKIVATSGQLIIAESNIDNYYGNKLPRTTILIKQLIFFDSTFMRNVKIENELFWKVRNFGTPG
ncbi:MAG: hypothetical protein ACPGVD_04420 [Flavobacteriales bacterium]